MKQDTDSDSESDLSTDSTSSVSDSDDDGISDRISVVEKSEAGASTNTDDDEEKNEVVKSILDGKKLNRNHPPSIILEDTVITDICFHPNEDIIGVASITGDILLYTYNNEETNLISTIESHLKACRDIEFSADGLSLFSVGKDLCIAITDVKTEKLTRFYDKAHEQPIYTMTIINEHMFATGDDDGVVKLWDLRQKENDPICSIKKVKDYISAMITNRDAKYLACASGNGYLTTINILERRMHIQSKEYDEEFTCLGLFKMESKLLLTTNKGKMYVYNWGEFGLHSDEFPNVTKKAINCMIPITQEIAITGGEDGILRAINLFPHRHLGIVGQHDFFVETLDINSDGNLIASSSHDNDIKFWNVEFFKELNVNEAVKGGKKKQLRYNLPSSQIKNRSDYFTDM